MKKLLLSFCLLPVIASGASADPFSDFKDQIISQGSAVLKPFVTDLGAVIGANDFSGGRSLKFPGFEAGVTGAVQAKPSKGNTLLRAAKVDAYGVPMLQAGAALPFLGLDVLARGMSYSGFSVIGGGLRLPLLQGGSMIVIPDVSVTAYYDSVAYDYFKGSHMSFDAAASFNIPIVKPFVGVGVDRSTLKIRGVQAGLDGKESTGSKPRYTVGLRVTPLPLLYVYGAFSALNGQHGYTAGAGVKF